MNFSDNAPVTSMRRTADGYLTGSVRCARTGVQDYLRTELGLEGEGMIAVYRPETAVFDKDSISTYAGKPITLGHPRGGVIDAANWKQLAIGTVGSKVLRDGETVVVDFSIMDAAAISGVDDGTREVSMGYTTPMVLQDGISPDGTPYQAVQTGPININHLAVVPAARGGSELRIGDAAINWGATPIHHGDKETPMSTKSVVLGDSAVVLPIADANVIEAYKADMTKKIADALFEKKKSDDEKDEEIGKLKAEKKTMEDAAVTPAKLTAMIADRVALEQQVKLIDAKIVCDNVADSDLRKAAVVSVLGDSAVLDATPAEINGMFKAVNAAKQTAPNDSVRNALGSHKFIDAGVQGWGDSVAKAAGVMFKKGA